jgi:hypothetical protein
MVTKAINVEFDDFTQGYLCELFRCALQEDNFKKGGLGEVPTIAFSELNLQFVNLHTLISVIDICERFQEEVGGKIDSDKFLAGIDFCLEHNEIGDGFSDGLHWGDDAEYLMDATAEFLPLEGYPLIFSRAFFESQQK